MASELRLVDVEGAWAARRLERFQELETSVQRTMGSLMQAASDALTGATEARHSMELDARKLVDEVRAERAALLQEVDLLRLDRDGLANDIADARRHAREEIAELRGAAEDAAAHLRGSAIDDAARMRRTAEDESAGLRRGAEQERTRLLDDAERRKVELMTEVEALERQLAGVGSRVHRILDLTSEPADSTSIADNAPVSAGPPPLAATEWATIAVAPEMTGAPGSSVVVEPDPEPSLEAPRTTLTVEANEQPAAPADCARVEVSLTNTPSFAEALEFQRGIQRTAGVRSVQATQFEGGTLVLRVEHDADVELDAALEALSSRPVDVVRRDPDRVEVAFRAA